MKKKWLFHFSLVTLISVILLTQVSVAAFKNVSVGATAPNITLKDLDGNDVSLEDIYKNNELTLLIFWAVCSPRSIEQLKDYQKFYDLYKEKSVRILAVNVESEDITEEDVAKIKSIIDENGIKFTVVMDEGLAAFRNYGVVAIPSSAIIKKDGEIVKDYASYATFAYLDILDNIEYELGIKERPKEVEIAEAAKRYKPVKASLLHYGLGKKLIQRGMADKAIREFKKASDIDGKFDQPHVLLAEVYYEKSLKQKSKTKKEQYLKDAKDEYLKALEINAENLPALSGLALVLIQEQNEKEAEESIEKALGLEPNFTPALAAKGVLFKNKGDKENAIENFKKALELNPNQPLVHYQMAMTYKDAGDNEQSVASLKEAFRILIKQVSLAKLQEHK